MDPTRRGFLVITGPVTRADVPHLCAQLLALLDDTGGRGARVVDCDVGALTAPDLAAVDVLARLQLTARRAGCRIRLRHPSGRLRALLALVGLGVEVLGEAEEREPPLGVQEGVEPDDLPP
ncbi:STAS domain-containing protein [Streptomyces sp. A3M-1-3]|uniref:STAS domain-containing protein n=1 Tax=Streptomyces sp. A3M-1-3 TaxID=2962044 RepID=UPI0020B8AACC|nr:STAS domain-containing protein [Streptomyces sp. A3M-1-3]MCP3818949.1 STAS domain-containing protein [Streptomyces sp. A3M-1-3]